jgi:hypothetical protein
VAIILRPGKTPDGTEAARGLRHVIGRIRARWPAVETWCAATAMEPPLRKPRPEAMAWCEPKRRVIVGVEAGFQGADNRFIITNLPGFRQTLYKVYCAGTGRTFEQDAQTPAGLRPRLMRTNPIVKIPVEYRNNLKHLDSLACRYG